MPFNGPPGSLVRYLRDMPRDVIIWAVLWMDFNAHNLANTAGAFAKLAGVDVACLAELARIAQRAARF